jgi:long-chain fatty acid transport protein
VVGKDGPVHHIGGFRMRIFNWVFAGIYLVCLAPALAAGYGLRESSAGAMGAAYAGAAATTSDASYQAYNPASIASVVGSDLSISAIGILPTSSASYTTARTSAGTPISGSTTPSGFISDALVPGIAVRTRLSDHWTAGVVVYAPWGLSTNYPASSAERYYALKTELTTINITPSVSYEISPEFAIAAGAQIEHAKGKLFSAIDIGTLGASLSIPGSIPGGLDGSANLSASNWGAGFVLGLIAHPADNVTAGISYHSTIQHHLAGNIDYTLDPAGLGNAIKTTTGLFTNSRASADLTTPDSMNFGLRADIAPQTTALFELDWTDWEYFHQLQVTSANPAQPNDITAANWQPAWFGAVGVEYRLEDQWSLRTGVAYDQTPIPSSTLNLRIPDADRITLAAGLTYRATDNADIKLSFEHLFIADRNISQNPTQPGNALRGTLIGTTQSSVNAVGAQFAYRMD